VNDASCCESIDLVGGTYYRGASLGYPATVSAFTLDRFEVTVERYTRFVAALDAGFVPAEGDGAHPALGMQSGWQSAWNTWLAAPHEPQCNTGRAYDDSFATWSLAANELLPVNCVDWYHAFAFCVWDGGRLPTDAEWEYAATNGSQESNYPWGNEPAPDLDHASFGCYFREGSGDSCALTDILSVGSFPAGANEWGHLDLAGSVGEWVLDYDQAEWLSPCTDCAVLSATGSGRRVRGGSFADSEFTLRISSVNSRNSGAPDQGHPMVGFRCARPAP
jgi:formylglycine-generating enzyme